MGIRISVSASVSYCALKGSFWDCLLPFPQFFPSCLLPFLVSSKILKCLERSGLVLPADVVVQTALVLLKNIFAVIFF